MRSAAEIQHLLYFIIALWRSTVILVLKFNSEN